jgi:hypothetical protein
MTWLACVMISVGQNRIHTLCVMPDSFYGQFPAHTTLGKHTYVRVVLANPRHGRSNMHSGSIWCVCVCVCVCDYYKQ